MRLATPAQTHMCCCSRQRRCCVNPRRGANNVSAQRGRRTTRTTHVRLWLTSYNSGAFICINARRQLLEELEAASGLRTLREACLAWLGLACTPSRLTIVRNGKLPCPFHPSRYRNDRLASCLLQSLSCMSNEPGEAGWGDGSISRARKCGISP